MRYIKSYNEELFYSKEISQKFIDSVLEEIESEGYKAKVSKSEKNPTDITLHKVTISVESKIGEIYVQLRLINQSNTSNVRISSALKKTFSKPRLIIEMGIGSLKGKYYTKTEFKSEDDVDVSSIANNVGYIEKRVSNERKVAKKKEDFYSAVPEDLLKDYLGDIRDIVGEYKIEKIYVSNSRMGYLITTNYTPDKLSIGTITSQSDNDKNFYKVDDTYLDLIKELSSLTKRLEELGLSVRYRLSDGRSNYNYPDGGKLQIIIYDMSSSDEDQPPHKPIDLTTTHTGF